MDHTVLPANTMPGRRHLTAAYYSFIDPKRMKSLRWQLATVWPALTLDERTHLCCFGRHFTCAYE